MTNLEKTLKHHEGLKDEVYIDSLGNPTCGWGHHLYPGSKVPLVACEAFFEQDLELAISEYHKISASLRRNLNKDRENVILNMIFNMGLQKVLAFKKMWTAIYDQDWDRAADEMLDSRWSAQVGNRSIELAKMMREGR